MMKRLNRMILVIFSAFCVQNLTFSSAGKDIFAGFNPTPKKPFLGTPVFRGKTSDSAPLKISMNQAKSIWGEEIANRPDSYNLWFPFSDGYQVLYVWNDVDWEKTDLKKSITGQQRQDIEKMATALKPASQPEIKSQMDIKHTKDAARQRQYKTARDTAIATLNNIKNAAASILKKPEGSILKRLEGVATKRSLYQMFNIVLEQNSQLAIILSAMEIYEVLLDSIIKFDIAIKESANVASEYNVLITRIDNAIGRLSKITDAELLKLQQQKRIALQAPAVQPKAVAARTTVAGAPPTGPKQILVQNQRLFKIIEQADLKALNDLTDADLNETIVFIGGEPKTLHSYAQSIQNRGPQYKQAFELINKRYLNIPVSKPTPIGRRGVLTKKPLKPLATLQEQAEAAARTPIVSPTTVVSPAAVTPTSVSRPAVFPVQRHAPPAARLAAPTTATPAQKVVKPQQLPEGITPELAKTIVGNLQARLNGLETETRKLLNLTNPDFAVIQRNIEQMRADVAGFEQFQAGNLKKEYEDRLTQLKKEIQKKKNNK